MELDTSLAPLLHSGWFKTLPSSYADRLLERATELQLVEDQILIHQQDDNTEALYCVLEGVIRVSTCSHQGKESVLTYLPPGTWFGEISIFDGLQRTHTAKAHEDSRLLKISRTLLMEILDDCPGLYPHLIKLFCEKIRLLMKLVDSRNLYSLQAQLAWRLFMLGESFGQKTEFGIELKLRLPQEDMAQMLGVSRQSVNKLLKQLESVGLISTRYRHVIITQPEKLNELLLYDQ